MSPEKLDRINNVLNELTKIRLEEEKLSQHLTSKQVLQKGVPYTMTTIQRYILLLGIIAIAVVGLFPPWSQKSAYIDNFFILSNHHGSIDYKIVITLWITIVLCVGGLILFFRKSK